MENAMKKDTTAKPKTTIEKADWPTLVRLYKRSKSATVRRAIKREARKYGYDWNTIEAIHG